MHDVIPQKFHFNASMVFHVIPLIGEDEQVIEAVIHGIAIDVVDDVGRLEGEDLGNGESGEALGRAILDVGAFGTGLYPGVVALYGAEVVGAVTDLAFMFEGFLSATMAGGGDAVFGGVDA